MISRLALIVVMAIFTFLVFWFNAQSIKRDVEIMSLLNETTATSVEIDAKIIDILEEVVTRQNGED